ncbi:polysaccharide deacetylase family protein [Paenibacillus sp. OV219]|uniref:polysaccharide deacetylase family protein n=1 Tax=Paenibacillus sp. OV219 TaxID=1884377 RepID=UPI0008AF07E2|nr:polysaccharide deacetylase family protein [Paenibacillus sp. OV219]SEO32434.1 polysaccharide deacetylase family sporulation protein PdaB [Paenibacillus sp. OV219]
MVVSWRLIAALLCIILLCGFDRPAKGRSFYEQRGDIIWELPMAKKDIALTFDDGPSPKATEEILDLLKEYNAKATFFVLGHRVKQFPNIIKREVAEGHEVANHTFHHVFFTNGITPATVQKEIVSTEDSLIELTGRKPQLFRPPGGYYNEQTVEIAKRLGYTTVLWSWHQDTEDWRSPGIGFIVRKVLNNARSGDIVLLHDYVTGNIHTVKALRVILPELAERGFRFVTVSELIHDKAKEMMNMGEGGMIHGTEVHP